MTKKLRKKKPNKKERMFSLQSSNLGFAIYCSPLDVMKKMGAIKTLIDKSLPTIDILTFDQYFVGLKEDICKYVRKGLRMNQLVMAIDKKFGSFETENFFKNRSANIQRHLSMDIYSLLKNLPARLTEDEQNELIETAKKELIDSFIIPLLYYDHKVEITIAIDDVKIIFTFKDAFKIGEHNVENEPGCMFMLNRRKDMITPLVTSNRTHSSISYRVVQTKDKLNTSDEPLIESKLMFDGSPLVFGYYAN